MMLTALLLLAVGATFQCIGVGMTIPELNQRRKDFAEFLAPPATVTRVYGASATASMTFTALPEPEIPEAAVLARLTRLEGKLWDLTIESREATSKLQARVTKESEERLTAAKKLLGSRDDKHESILKKSISTSRPALFGFWVAVVGLALQAVGAILAIFS
jgi:hypothetical protein